MAHHTTYHPIISQRINKIRPPIPISHTSNLLIRHALSPMIPLTRTAFLILRRQQLARDYAA